VKVLVTGAQGYIGLPLSKKLRDEGHDVYLIDNMNRENWVFEVGGASLTQLDYLAMNANIDLTDFHAVREVLEDFQPDVIMHLASQPSGPFSELSSEHRVETQVCNLAMLMNLLCASHDLKLSPKFIVSTTTGVPGAPDQPIVEGHTPNMAGSTYHVSRGFDSANLQLAAKQWKFRILELRTSIVFGTRLEGSVKADTRFDWDFCFGTLVHRLCLMKRMGMRGRIYGKGLQRKPFISLRDCVRSFVNAVDYEVNGHVIMNQTTLCLSPVEIAKQAGVEVEHIPNPRVENEEHQMVIHNEKFLKLLNKNGPVVFSTVADEAEGILQDINISFLPKNWEEVYSGVRKES